MRTLFARILLWFLAALAVTVFGLILVTEFNIRSLQSRENVFARLITFQMEEAVHAWETGGPAALTAYLDRFRNFFGAEALLADASGRDLLSGADHAELIGRAQFRVPFLLSRARRVVIGRTNGRYWFFVLIERPRAGPAFFLPQFSWVLGAVVLICWGLAYHLTSPLRRLQKAVERFGRGDFSARVDLKRRDELGQLAATFNQMAARLETLLATERRLLLDVSHELRSPLSRLSVAVELARSGQDADAALNRIQKEADRLNALVQELLQVTRAEVDPSARRSEPVRLDQLLTSLAEDCSVEANARQCRLELEAKEETIVRGDPELLRRAVENVLRNAIRHAPSGTAVEVALTGGVIRIRDYGPGVPEEALPRLFDPFYRVETDRDRASGGVGLGLAIARRAVELHKGRITARNAHPGLEVQIAFRAA